MPDETDSIDPVRALEIADKYRAVRSIRVDPTAAHRIAIQYGLSADDVLRYAEEYPAQG